MEVAILLDAFSRTPSVDLAPPPCLGPEAAGSIVGCHVLARGCFTARSKSALPLSPALSRGLLGKRA